MTPKNDDAPDVVRGTNRVCHNYAGEALAVTIAESPAPHDWEALTATQRCLAADRIEAEWYARRWELEPVPVCHLIVSTTDNPEPIWW